MLVYKKLPLLIQTYISLLLKYLYLLSCYIHFILCERNYLETPSAAKIIRVLNRRVNWRIVKYLVCSTAK